MFFAGGKKIIDFVESKGDVVLKIAFFLGIFPQTISLILNYEDIIEDPVYLISIAVSFYVFIMICCAIFLIKRKKKLISGLAIYFNNDSDKEGKSTYHYGFWLRLLVGFVMFLLSIAVVCFILRQLKTPTPPKIEEDTCKAIILEKSWTNLGASVTVKNIDTSYHLRIARLFSPSKLACANVFEGMDCALELILAPKETVKKIIIDSINIILEEYLPLPEYIDLKSAKKYMKKDSVIILNLQHQMKEIDSLKQETKIIVGEQIYKYKPIDVFKGNTRRLLMRINADKEGIYTFKVKLNLIVDNDPVCEYSPVQSIQWLFIK